MRQTLHSLKRASEAIFFGGPRLYEGELAPIHLNIFLSRPIPHIGSICQSVIGVSYIFQLEKTIPIAESFIIYTNQIKTLIYHCSLPIKTLILQQTKDFYMQAYERQLKNALSIIPGSPWNKHEILRMLLSLMSDKDTVYQVLPAFMEKYEKLYSSWPHPYCCKNKIVHADNDWLYISKKRIPLSAQWNDIYNITLIQMEDYINAYYRAIVSAFMLRYSLHWPLPRKEKEVLYNIRINALNINEMQRELVNALIWIE